MKIIKFFIFLLSINIKYSFADLKILSWDQENIFNDLGQEVSVKVKLKAINLQDNYYYESWSYIFDNKTKVDMLEAKVLNPPGYESYFGDNKLTIKFNKLFNNKETTLYFKYQLINDENIKYIKRERVQIPYFVNGANASLKVTTINDMDVYSTNEIFNYNGSYYFWEGIVPKDGISELFNMTLKEAKWLVSTTVNIENRSNTLNNIEVTLPLNFIGGNNEIFDYKITVSQNENIIEKNKDNINVKFNKYNESNGFIKIEAKIKNNYNNFYWLNNFNIIDTLNINSSYISKYNTLISKILDNDKSSLPTHIKIAKWVHNNISYDLSYLGKDMTSEEILYFGKGVCEHYAILYQDLLRSIGIPAKTISGISYSFEKNKFENHAWVMINYNSQWIPIDPTWGIYSGKLPISHIFLYNDIKNSIKYSSYDNISSINLNIINDAVFLEKDI